MDILFRLLWTWRSVSSIGSDSISRNSFTVKKTSRFITGVLLIFRCVSETCIAGAETQHVHGTQHVRLRRPRIENNP